MKTKLSYIIIATAMYSISNYTTAQQSIILHDKDVAESAYDAFKNGNAIDPLETIRKGYSESYEAELNSSLLNQKSSDTNTMLNTELERVSQFRDMLKADKASQKTAIYKNSINQDGTFNSEAYAASYGDYLSSNKNSVEIALGDRQSFTESIFQNSKNITEQSAETHSNNASIASQNIIDLINSKKIIYSNEVKEKLDTAVENSGNKIPVGEETIILAYEFDGYCGTACVLPEIPPTEEEVVSCFYDENNYISYFESDHSEYGTWETRDIYEVWMYNSVVVYSYSYDYSNRGGRPVENEETTGSTSGYTAGELIYSNTGGSQFGSSTDEESEICLQ